MDQVFKILYIEDSLNDQYLMRHLLKHWLPSVTLFEAKTASLGLEAAIIKQPDLILMDINLPIMSGYEALEILKNEPVTRHIPVWAVTAFAYETDIRQGLNAGFTEYITKPLIRESLVGLIQKEMDKNRS